MDNLFFDNHIHTTFCCHATGTLDEYAQRAQLRGIDGIVITCHAPLPNGWSPEIRMRLDEFDAYLATVDEAAQRWRASVRVLAGLECDYTPGLEGWLAELLSRRRLDCVLGSVHPHISPFLECASSQNMLELQKIYFDHLVLAAQSGLFHIIAHPDVVKSYYPKDWQPSRIMDHVRRALDKISKCGVILELNTSGLLKPFVEMNPSTQILKEMRVRDIPVALGSDAHRPEQVCAHFEEALSCLSDTGYSEVHYCIGGQRYRSTIPELVPKLRVPPSQSGTFHTLNFTALARGSR